MLKLALVLAVLLGATIARADVAPPPNANCEEKKVGVWCQLAGGKEGRCAQGESCYVPVGCDAGGQPCQRICTPVILCQECKECESGCAFAPGRPAPAAALGGLLLAFALTFVALRRLR